MADFATALPVILKHEGGYAWDPADPGGETNWGISRAFCNKVGLPDEDIKNMTQERAAQLYRQHFWSFDNVVNQMAATKVFDMVVNMGTRQGILLAQRAANELDGNCATDGVWGPATCAALNACPGVTLVQGLIAQSVKFYEELAHNKPELAKFLPQWLVRAQWPGVIGRGV